MGYTIDIDTGGTFTDGFFVRGDRVETVKVPTTPHDLTVCFLKCVEAGARRFGADPAEMLYHTDIIRFSNTIGTNTIIQRNGSKVGLLVSAGQEGLAPTTAEEGLTPLVLPDMVLGLEEETSPEGQVLRPPDERQALAAAQALIDRGARCLVVALAQADVNPANERAVRRTVKREYPRDFLGSLPIFLSSDISRRAGHGQRLNAALLSAYIHAKLVRLLYKAGEELRQRDYAHSLFIVHNNGAVARVAKTRAINTYNSGPAAGLLGACLVGGLYEQCDLISADMGGTSFDIGYVRAGQPSFTLQPEVEGLAVNLPMLSIRALGAGGGSIAEVKDGALRVGPQSAGALPGPVCFDLGGMEPTVTDADLALGVLDPLFFLGGGMRLNPDKARAVLDEKVAGPLGVRVERAALMIKRNIDAAMAQGVRQSLKVFPAGSPPPLMVVYGGAGPAHCCHVAELAGLERIVITPHSAVFSAFSSSNMDVGHVYYRRLEMSLDGGLDLAALRQAARDMRAEAERDMRGEGFAPRQISHGLELYLRLGQGQAEVKAALGLDELEAGDDQAIALIRQRAAQACAEAGLEPGPGLVASTASLLSQAPVPHYQMGERPLGPADCRQARKGARRLWLDDDGQGREVAVYDREQLAPGAALAGPALVESRHTTILVPTGWGLMVDRFDNALLQREV